jgi:septal ring factor EnvC (AmiA/AmiB activator)
MDVIAVLQNEWAIVLTAPLALAAALAVSFVVASMVTWLVTGAAYGSRLKAINSRIALKDEQREALTYELAKAMRQHAELEAKMRELQTLVETMSNKTMFVYTVSEIEALQKACRTVAGAIAQLQSTRDQIEASASALRSVDSQASAA